jgi:hypothetical protein
MSISKKSGRKKLKKKAKTTLELMKEVRVQWSISPVTKILVDKQLDKKKRRQREKILIQEGGK